MIALNSIPMDPRLELFAMLFELSIVVLAIAFGLLLSYRFTWHWATWWMIPGPLVTAATLLAVEFGAPLWWPIAASSVWVVVGITSIAIDNRPRSRQPVGGGTRKG